MCDASQRRAAADCPAGLAARSLPVSTLGATVNERRCSTSLRLATSYEFADDERDLVEEPAVLCIERGEAVTVHIDLADGFAVNADRRDDLRLRFERTGEIARVAVDVVDDDRRIERDGRAADAGVDRDPDVRRWRSIVRPEDEHLIVMWIEHVEAGPRTIGRKRHERVHDCLLKRRKTRFLRRARLDLRDDLGPVRAGDQLHVVLSRTGDSTRCLRDVDENSAMWLSQIRLPGSPTSRARLAQTMRPNRAALLSPCHPVESSS